MKVILIKVQVVVEFVVYSNLHKFVIDHFGVCKSFSKSR